MDIKDAIAATLLAGVVTFFTRLFPFVMFRNRPPTPMFTYAQRHIPPMTMVILVVYCLKDVDLRVWGLSSPSFAVAVGVSSAALLHLWRGNALISIFCATALYMWIIRLQGHL